MTVKLYIERPTLDGISPSPGERPVPEASIVAQLTRLLASAGLSEAPQSGGALHRVKTFSIQLTRDENPTQLLKQIAGVVVRV